MIIVSLAQTKYVSEEIEYPVMAISMHYQEPFLIRTVNNAEDLMSFCSGCFLLSGFFTHVVITSITGDYPTNQRGNTK